MGTPDSFIVDDLRCPACKRGDIRELQTKVIPDPYMDKIRLGDEIPRRTQGGDLLLDIADGRVLCWGTCGECDSWLQYYALIKANRWVGLELASVDKLAKRPG